MARSRPPDTHRVPTAKVVPPSLPSLRIERPLLLSRLHEALGRRLTTIVAGPGYGKSSALAAWAADANAAWYSVTADDRDVARLALGLTEALRLRVPGIPADLLAAPLGMAGPDAESHPGARASAAVSILAQALHERLQRDVAIILDDLHELPPSSPAMNLVGDLVRQAPGFLHLVMASRDEPPLRVERLRGHGQVLELTAADIAFQAVEVAALLGLAIGPASESIADAVYELTGGWPAAVRMAIEALRREPPEAHLATLERLRRPGGSIFAYLAEEVIAREPAPVRRLITAVAPLRGFTPELCAALGVEDAHELLPSLDRRGLFLEPDRTRAGWYALSPLVRDYALEARTAADGDPVQQARLAADWMVAHDDPAEALSTLLGVDAPADVARLLESHGQTILERGAVSDVMAAAGRLDASSRTPAIEQLEGQARQVMGDWQGALACYRRAAAETPDLPPGLAWRMGVMHHLRGELDQAERVYGAADMSAGEDRERALLLSWQASAHWLRGDEAACRAAADQALALATRARDDQALAAAHTVQAMLGALRGDRRANDEHYLMALDHAEGAGDVLQLIRIRANRGSRLLEEAAYREALDELGIAIQLAGVAGFAAFHALALSNRGDTQARLGRLEEAVADLEAARDTYQRIGSRMIAYPLAKLGEVHRMRGDRALARAAFEESRELGEESGDHQALVPALGGLARVLAVEQPEEASSLAGRAIALAAGTWHVGALLAGAWVALAQGRSEEARGLADEAEGTARSRRDLAGLAEALELQAAATRDEAGSSLLDEASRIWRAVGNPIGVARVELRLARLAGDEEAAADAVERLEALGARGVRGEVDAGAAHEGRPPVELHLLGGFQLLRNGQPVPLTAWQSRKARDLLKMLATRSGHPAPRDALMEALWPDEPADALANRFSVALSTVRQVLDPDRRFPSNHFIAADKAAVRLRVEELPVDVHRFLALARRGLGGTGGANRGAMDLAELARAEGAYTGDLLEEDAYADWATPLREEARSAYVAVARALADHAARAGDQDSAIRLLLRLLERDPYDERAHLALVSAMFAAGRHGAARQAYRSYCARMDEIDVESAPYPTAASTP